MIVSHLEELVCQSHSLFPVLFDCVVFVKFLKFREMGSEVFLGYDLVKNCFLKLVVFDLEPEIVLAFG